MNGACSHEVFCPFNATQPIRATAPGLSMPGSCCVLLLTMQFDALLPNRSPRCLSTGCVHGVQCPSELALTEIILTSRSEFPLVRLANRSCACPIDRSQRATCLAGPQLIRATFVAGLSRYAGIRGPFRVGVFQFRVINRTCANSARCGLHRGLASGV